MCIVVLVLIFNLTFSKWWHGVWGKQGGQSDLLSIASTITAQAPQPSPSASASASGPGPGSGPGLVQVPHHHQHNYPDLHDATSITITANTTNTIIRFPCFLSLAVFLQSFVTVLIGVSCS